jgi:hypothetical protein
MNPVLHCRIDLTKIGIAASFWTGLQNNSGREQKAQRENDKACVIASEAKQSRRACGDREVVLDCFVALLGSSQ